MIRYSIRDKQLGQFLYRLKDVNQKWIEPFGSYEEIKNWIKENCKANIKVFGENSGLERIQYVEFESEEDANLFTLMLGHKYMIAEWNKWEEERMEWEKKNRASM